MHRTAWITIAVLLAAATLGSWTAAVRVGQVKPQVEKLNGQVTRLQEEVLGVPASSGPEEKAEIKNVADMEAAIRKLDDAATAQQLAECLHEIDAWVIDPSQEQEVLKLKLDLAARLRIRVQQEVREKQEMCSKASSGDEAIRLHGEAGQILALYPMSEATAVVEEARALSAVQVKVANRIDVLRRQRYNQWACKQIEKAIDGYNKGSSYWSPKKENKALMDSLVQALGEIDPVLIEPAVMELYNYVIELTKNSISQKDKIELATRLTDPSIQRKTLGDF